MCWRPSWRLPVRWNCPDTPRSVGCRNAPNRVFWQQDVKEVRTVTHYVTGDTVKTLREKKNYTQKQLADLLGVSDKAISK